MFVPHLIPEASAQTHWHFPAQKGATREGAALSKEQTGSQGHTAATLNSDRPQANPEHGVFAWEPPS